jgi:hypothetical protein
MNVMHLIQNLKRKSIAVKSMILLAAITLSTAVATDDALAAGHGGGAPGASGGVGGSHTGAGLSGGPIGRGFGGSGFAGGHLGAGRVDGRMAGDHSGGRGEAFLGDRGWGYPESTLRGGLHDRHHHFHERFVGVPGYYYDDYGYGLDDYADNNACFQYRHVYTTSGWQWRQVWICN